MNNLECLIYISRCTLDRSALEAQLDDIVAISALRNRTAKINGILAYQDGQFVQILEGAPAALDLLMIHLHFDQRHEDIRVICREKIPSKQAMGWAMISPPAKHPLRQDLQSLLNDPPAGLAPWRRVLLEMVAEDA